MAWFDEVKQEAEYRQWLIDHPQGFVLNHQKGSKLTNNRAHRANCTFILRTAENTAPGRLLLDYVKFCSPSYQDLASALLARNEGARYTPCKFCSPEE